jgi:hypothetical protein
MGFLSNLKNAVTGGAASVQLHVPASVPRNESVPIRVTAMANSDCEIRGVYVLVRAMEEAQVRDTDFEEDGDIDREIVRGRRASYENRIPLGGGQQLVEGQEYTWEGELQLPSNVGPSFRGQMIRHEWEMQAGLDARGNDPDSGWISIEVI